jgi:hypothetical protein
MAIELDGLYGLTSDGNITTGNFFIGNGSQLTGITSSYNDANVTALLASGTVTIVDVSDVEAQSIQTIDLTAFGNISTTASFIGDGSSLTGMYGNSNATALLASGNVTIANITTVNTAALSTTDLTAYGNSAFVNINATGDVTAAGNVSGNYIVGVPKSTVENSSATTLSITQQVTTFSAPTAVTVTLPLIDSSTIGVQYTIVDTWGGSRGLEPIDINVADPGNETIDGATTVQLTAAYGVFVVMCVSATEWIVISN